MIKPMPTNHFVLKQNPQWLFNHSGADLPRLYWKGGHYTGIYTVSTKKKSVAFSS